MSLSWGVKEGLVEQEMKEGLKCHFPQMFIMYPHICIFHNSFINRCRNFHTFVYCLEITYSIHFHFIEFYII